MKWALQAILRTNQLESRSCLAAVYHSERLALPSSLHDTADVEYHRSLAREIEAADWHADAGSDGNQSRGEEARSDGHVLPLDTWPVVR